MDINCNIEVFTSLFNVYFIICDDSICSFIHPNYYRFIDYNLLDSLMAKGKGGRSGGHSHHGSGSHGHHSFGSHGHHSFGSHGHHGFGSHNHHGFGSYNSFGRGGRRSRRHIGGGFGLAHTYWDQITANITIPQIFNGKYFHMGS